MENNKKTADGFFGNGFFDWQLSGEEYEAKRKEWKFNEEKYWGGFSREPVDPDLYKPPAWAIGHFKKHGKPVLAPTEGKWDCGRMGGGVHNGSVLWRNGQFYYIYRGERPIPEAERANPNIGYICDIGLAISKDGINFEKRCDVSPFFGRDGDERYSFEDVNISEYDGRYYMFVNRWDWAKFDDPSVSGIYMAYSDDLINWTKHGLVYPGAKRIHRNGVVLQNAKNEAVRVNGKFVMYINDALMGFSDDMIRWESVETDNLWPGGEGCFALADYDKNQPDNIILFTGGHHTGHFYAVGEVLFSKNDVTKPLDWLPRPVLYAEERYPWENCLSETEPRVIVSDWRDTVFFNGLLLHEGKWKVYYGGSEYYTCFAFSEDKAT